MDLIDLVPETRDMLIRIPEVILHISGVHITYFREAILHEIVREVGVHLCVFW